MNFSKPAAANRSLRAPMLFTPIGLRHRCPGALAFRPRRLIGLVSSVMWLALSPNWAPGSNAPENDKPQEGHSAPATEHSGEAESPGEKPGAAHSEAPAVSTYVLGAALDGFDLSVLRSSRRVVAWRHTLLGIRSPTLSNDRHAVYLSLSVEFGRESGMAEMAYREDDVREGIGEIIDAFSTAELLTVDGKMRFKEEIIAALNEFFITARVRQVYLLDFRLLPTSLGG